MKLSRDHSGSYRMQDHQTTPQQILSKAGSMYNGDRTASNGKELKAAKNQLKDVRMKMKLCRNHHYHQSSMEITPRLTVSNAGHMNNQGSKASKRKTYKAARNQLKGVHKEMLLCRNHAKSKRMHDHQSSMEIPTQQTLSEAGSMAPTRKVVTTTTQLKDVKMEIKLGRDQAESSRMQDQLSFLEITPRQRAGIMKNGCSREDVQELWKRIITFQQAKLSSKDVNEDAHASQVKQEFSGSEKKFVRETREEKRTRTEETQRKRRAKKRYKLQSLYLVRKG